jgi:hypothetical protein
MGHRTLEQSFQSFERSFEEGLQASTAVIGSPALYATVRAAFIRQGSSLNRWCVSNGLSRFTVERALTGKSTTRSALAIVSRAVEAARPTC